MSNLLEYLDRAGVQTLAKSLLEKVNERIVQRIVTDVNANSTNDNVIPSAKAVYTAIQSSLSGIGQLTFETHVGDINEVQNPSESNIYLQKDTEEATNWNLYIYKDKQWTNIGDTKIDLDGYWAKTDTSAMKTALGIDELNSNLEDLGTLVEDHINNIEELNDDVINSIVSQAFTDTLPSL